MTLRQYVVSMVLGTCFSWIAWGLILLTIDPFAASTTGFVLFYVSLFLALLGTLSLIRFGWYRRSANNDLPMFRLVEQSFRDACFVAAVLVGLLYLRGLSLLHWWNFFLFILFLIMIFLWKMSFKRSTKQTESV